MKTIKLLLITVLAVQFVHAADDIKLKEPEEALPDSVFSIESAFMCGKPILYSSYPQVNPYIVVAHVGLHSEDKPKKMVDYSMRHFEGGLLIGLFESYDRENLKQVSSQFFDRLSPEKLKKHANAAFTSNLWGYLANQSDKLRTELKNKDNEQLAQAASDEEKKELLKTLFKKQVVLSKIILMIATKAEGVRQVIWDSKSDRCDKKEIGRAKFLHISEDYDKDRDEKHIPDVSLCHEGMGITKAQEKQFLKRGAELLSPAAQALTEVCVEENQVNSSEYYNAQFIAIHSAQAIKAIRQSSTTPQETTDSEGDEYA